MNNLGAFDWSDLRYFLAVAREGSSLAAARVLRVSQSTVHRRLIELENHLGCALAERHPTGYRLTRHGKELRPYAERVEQAASALGHRAATFNTAMKGVVRLTCSTTVAHRLMKSALIERFHRQCPGIKIELVMTERVLDLAKREADIAIRGGEAHQDTLVGKKVADVPWGIYASRSYVERNGTPGRTADIARHGIIKFTGEIADLAAARWLPSRAPRARITGQASNVPSVLLAVKSGVGLAPLPAPLADLDRDLVQLFGPVPELTYPMFLFTHRDLRRIPRVAAVFEYCLAELRPILTGAGHRNRQRRGE